MRQPTVTDARVVFSTDMAGDRHTDLLYSSFGVGLASRFNGHIPMDTCILTVLAMRKLTDQQPGPAGAA